MGVVWTFFLSSLFSFLSPSLLETARYRLKYCLKGPLNPKQPSNQSKGWRQTAFDFIWPFMVNLVFTLALNGIEKGLPINFKSFGANSMHTISATSYSILHAQILDYMTYVWNSLPFLTYAECKYRFKRRKIDINILNSASKIIQKYNFVI